MRDADKPYLIYVHGASHNFEVESVFNGYCFGDKLCALLNVPFFRCSRTWRTTSTCCSSSATTRKSTSSSSTPPASASTCSPCRRTPSHVSSRTRRERPALLRVPLPQPAARALLRLRATPAGERGQLQQAGRQELGRVPAPGRADQGDPAPRAQPILPVLRSRAGRVPAAGSGGLVFRRSGVRLLQHLPQRPPGDPRREDAQPDPVPRPELRGALRAGRGRPLAAEELHRADPAEEGEAAVGDVIG